jgi:putative RNA ligase
MTQLADMFPMVGFDRMAHLGYIRIQKHPRLVDYEIANYTEKAVYDKEWNDVTLQCRGLIYNALTGAVIARPWKKFFNHNESTAPTIGLNDPVVVTDKLDGSLGILYPTPDGRWAIATRGSFDSPQARHATQIWQQYYEREWSPIPGITYLFEIIYPENRIVVDYNQLDDIVLLGAVDIATGRSIAPEVIQNSNNPWPGPVTETFAYDTYGQALAAAPRPGKEGFVVHDLRTDERVKIKQEDYVVLHRLVTGLTARRVHEAVLQGVDLDEFIAPLPDEFHDWVRDVAGRIEDQVRDAKATVEHQWLQVVAECEERSPEADDPGFPEDAASADRHEGTPRLGTGGWPTSVSMGLETGKALSRDQRKLFAEVAKGYSYAWALFAKLDGRDYERKLLESADPGVETPQGRTFSEATA